MNIVIRNDLAGSFLLERASKVWDAIIILGSDIAVTDFVLQSFSTRAGISICASATWWRAARGVRSFADPDTIGWFPRRPTTRVRSLFPRMAGVCHAMASARHPMARVCHSRNGMKNISATWWSNRSTAC